MKVQVVMAFVRGVKFVFLLYTGSSAQVGLTVVGREPRAKRCEMCLRVIVGSGVNQPEGRYQGHTRFVSGAGAQECQPGSPSTIRTVRSATTPKSTTELPYGRRWRRVSIMKQRLAFLASLGCKEMSAREVSASLREIGRDGMEWMPAHFNPRTMSERELADAVAVMREEGVEVREAAVQ